ncbi:MAG: autotransporter-associated beta strand repeat-containing protein [Verrucomicrobia bacterium]|nr:autotransporter-associated beta strand repeat-containing protein [Verrucomicrobiota bacterium]
MKTTTRSRKNTQILAGSIAALVLATHSAQAASAAWNVNADGAWVTDSNWTPAAAPGAVTGTASADVATFSNTLTLFGKTITVDANRNIGGISFGNATAFGFTLTGGNLLLSNASVIQSLAADGGHMETIASAIAIQGDSGSASFTALSTNGNTLLNIAGAVTGVSTAGNTTTLNLNGTNLGGNEVTGIIGDGSLGGKLALTKSAAGTWFLTGSNTYTGTTTLTAGTLVAENANALGSGGNVTFGGGTLRYTAYSAGTDWSTRFKNSTAAGGIILDLNFQDVTLAGVIDSSNTAGLNRSGAGSLTLSGANTYTGVTTIGGNTASAVASYLKLNNALALGGGGNLTFTNGTLQFSSNNTVDYSSRIVGSTSAVNIDTNGQSVTFASPLVASNNAGLTKLGLGSLTLQGASNNAYLNITTISGGDLIINNTVDNAADRLSSGTLVINGGRLLFNGNASANSAESVGQINVGGGASTLSVNFGGTQTATLTSTGQMAHNLTNGTMLINGVNLGKNNSSTSSVARVLVTTAPTGTNLVGTTAALVTGINSAVKNTQIVPFLTGEATTTTGGLGTASGTSNTFVTYVGGAGFRPLNPTDEFTNNAITVGSNTRLTSATTAASTGAINSLVMAGGDLTINDSNAGSLVTLTNTSGAILFTATSTIKPSSTAGVLSFGTAEGQITVNAGVTATIRANMTQTANTQGITK